MVINEEQGLLMLRDANPVPELQEDPVSVDAALHLITRDQGSSEVTQLSTKDQDAPKRDRSRMGWLVAAALALVIGVAVIVLNQGTEEPPPATDPVPTTVAPPTTSALPSTTVVESALADIPVWLRSGTGQWVPAQSAIPFAFTNADGWNSLGTALNAERFTICPSTEDGTFQYCNLASVSVLFLEPETIEATRELLASFEGAELGDEQSITINGASGIRFEFTHDVAPVSEQVEGEIPVPAAYVADLGGSSGSRLTPLGEGPLGQSIISIVDVDGVVVTLSYQGVATARGAAEDGFDTYRDEGLAIIDSIIWGTP